MILEHLLLCIDPIQIRERFSIDARFIFTSASSLLVIISPRYQTQQLELTYTKKKFYLKQKLVNNLDFVPSIGQARGPPESPEQASVLPSK